jgi:hypothetical protein
LLKKFKNYIKCLYSHRNNNFDLKKPVLLYCTIKKLGYRQAFWLSAIALVLKDDPKGPLHLYFIPKICIYLDIHIAANLCFLKVSKRALLDRRTLAIFVLKIKYASSAYLRQDFIELARYISFENLWHPPETLTLLSRGLPPC